MQNRVETTRQSAGQIQQKWDAFTFMTDQQIREAIAIKRMLTELRASCNENKQRKC